MRSILFKIADFVFSERMVFFLTIWLLLGALVNTKDQEAYTLQHAGVDAVVSHGTYQLGKSNIEKLRVVGDTFHYKWRGDETIILAAKQPGQFTYGAIPYYVLKAFGFSYEDDYVKAGVLVTFFSTAFMVALAALCIQQLLSSLWRVSKPLSYLAAVSYAFGSIVCAYSGVLHHDAMAGALLIFAFYFFERHKSDMPIRSGAVPWSALLSGFLAGQVLFTSMLASLVTLGLCVYVASHFIRRSILWYLLGFMVGLVPLGAYNLYYFGSPITQANVAGNFKDTFFTLDAKIFSDHLWQYFGAGEIVLWQYMPIVFLGLIGLVACLRVRPHQSLFILGAMLLHSLYILNIETIGHCQFGPRYFLPLVPFLCLGIPALLGSPTPFAKVNRGVHAVIVSLFAYSVGVNIIGAVGGTMYCDLSRYAPISYLSAFSKETLATLPLLPGCISFLSIFLVLAWRYHSRDLYQAETAIGQATRAIKRIYASMLINEEQGFGSLQEQERSRALFVAVGIVFALLVGAVYFYSNPYFDSPFDYTRRVALALLHGQLGITEQPPGWLNEFVPWNDNSVFYSVFPLGAVLSMMPLALLNQLELVSGFPASAVNAVVMAISFLFFMLIAKRYGQGLFKSTVLSLSLFLGTFTWTTLAFGGAWQVALGFAVMGQLGALYFSLVRRQPLLAGLFFAISFGNRTEIILTAPLYLYLLVREDGLSIGSLRKNIFAVGSFCAVPFALGVLTLCYNFLRFGSIVDFGYARIPGVLQEPWYLDGIFSWSYIPRNFKQMVWQPWRMLREFPYIVPTGFGGSIFLSSPLLLFAFRLRKRNADIKRVAWLAVGILTLVLWVHGNPGGWQFSYRYAMVLLPWLYLLILESEKPRFSAWLGVLTAYSLVINAYATWLFHWTRYVQP